MSIQQGNERMSPFDFAFQLLATETGQSIIIPGITTGTRWSRGLGRSSGIHRSCLDPMDRGRRPLAGALAGLACATT
nr:hypothetical protein CFP56_30132 [Quercus suber]